MRCGSSPSRRLNVWFGGGVWWTKQITEWGWALPKSPKEGAKVRKTVGGHAKASLCKPASLWTGYGNVLCHCSLDRPGKVWLGKETRAVGVGYNQVETGNVVQVENRVQSLPGTCLLQVLLPEVLGTQMFINGCNDEAEREWLQILGILENGKSFFQESEKSMYGWSSISTNYWKLKRMMNEIFSWWKAYGNTSLSRCIFKSLSVILSGDILSIGAVWNVCLMRTLYICLRTISSVL